MYLEALHRNLEQNKLGIVLLTIASLFFACGVKLKNFAYDFGLKSSKKVGLPVISIGNIAVGGTGKTPFTMLLANHLKRTFKIAVLTRGYRSLVSKNPVVVSHGQGPLLSTREIGDEAYLLASNLKDVIVISGKERMRSASLAKELGAELILLDDGMQHRKIHRDLDIVLADESDTFLPRGRLRDEKKRLNRADFIVSTTQNLNHQKPSMQIAFRPGDLIFSDGIKREIKGKKVALFCGIAKPENFVKTVEQLGAIVVASQFLADHEKMETNCLKDFVDLAKQKGSEYIFCTEKDWVKLEERHLSLPLAMVKKEIFITKNASAFDALLNKITRWRKAT